MRKLLRQLPGFLVEALKVYPALNRFTRKKNLGKYSSEVRFGRLKKALLAVNRKSFHIRFEIQGASSLPSGQVLLTPNHQSDMDPLALVMVFERPIGFVSKKENMKLPLIGKAMKSLDSVFIDRADLRSEVKAYREAEERLKKEKSLSYVVFPEGTRSHAPDFSLGLFHPGSFKMAVRLSLPIVPVAIYGAERILNPDYHYKVYPVQISYLEPVLPQDYENLTTAEIAELVRNRIQDELFLMKKKDRKLVQEENGYSEKKLARVLVSTKKHKHRY